MYSYFLFLPESVMIPLRICQFMFSLYMKYCSWFLSNFIIYAFSIVSLSLLSFDIFLYFLLKNYSYLMVSPTTWSLRNLSPVHHILLRLWLWSLLIAYLQSQLNEDVRSSTLFLSCLYFVCPTPHGQGHLVLVRWQLLSCLLVPGYKKLKGPKWQP